MAIKKKVDKKKSEASKKGWVTRRKNLVRLEKRVAKNVKKTSRTLVKRATGKKKK